VGNEIVIQVRLSGAPARRFTIDTWEAVQVKDGILVINDNDHHSAVYAPGVWQTVEELG
jgi:hypothetical protein